MSLKTDNRPMGLTDEWEIELGPDQKRTVRVYEIRPYDVLSIIRDVEAETPVTDLADELLPLCSNLNRADLWGPDALFPSQIREVWERFRKVNSAFFDTARRADLLTHLRRIAIRHVGPEMMAAAESELARLFSAFSGPATQTPSISDGTTS